MNSTHYIHWYVREHFHSSATAQSKMRLGKIRSALSAQVYACTSMCISECECMLAFFGVKSTFRYRVGLVCRSVVAQKMEMLNVGVTNCFGYVSGGRC